MTDSRRLSDDEARVLRGLETLPDPAQYGAWVLRAKDVPAMRLGAAPLGDLLWDDVHFTDAQWASGALRRAQIQRCRFTTSTFADCVFEDVLFLDCVFNGLQASATQFRRCRFERCVFDGLQAPSSAFLDCTFDATRLLDGDLRETTLQDCTLSGCELEFVRAARSRFAACTFAGGSLRNCRFSYLETRDLTFERVEFEQMLFVGGEHERWQISAARGSVLKLVSVQMRKLVVTGCAELASLRLITSQANDMRLSDNPMLIGFSIFRSEVTALRIADTVLAYSIFDEAKIGPSSAYEAVAFLGFSVSDSELTRPQFMRCRFGDYFYLHRTQLHSLVADDLRYDAGLREIHDAVTYPNTTAHLGSRP